MIHIDFDRLRPVGLTQSIANEATAMIQTEDAELMRLTEVHRETVRLHEGSAEHGARILPALARSLMADDTSLAVGDWVFVRTQANGERWVCDRVAPLNHIARRDSDGKRHAIVSNVDTAFVVMGLDDDFNLRRLERYLALVQGSGVMPVIVLSKKDVCPDLEAALDSVRKRIAGHIDLLAVNGLEPASALLLAPWCATGNTIVLLGSSGAGKSTLANTLMGTAIQDTGAVREHDSRGKHTTTARHLMCLPGGACIIDTPGLRTLRADVDEQTVASSFEDIGTLAVNCRFHNCRHKEEPDCAVRAAIDPDRLRNYHKMLREARRDTLSIMEKHAQLASWKARGRAAHARLKMKRAGS
jgi:ribosome biogenesis GTPase / thiamine phosphate phosphatase